MKTKEELVSLVKKIIAYECTEEELNLLIEELNASVQRPDADYVIYGKEYEGLSAEEIVDEILSYQPILLP